MSIAQTEADFRKAYADIIFFDSQSIEKTDLKYTTEERKSMEQRDLHWKASHSITIAETVRLVTFDYNETERRDLAFLAAHRLADRFAVTLAREYSFCLYLTVSGNFSSEEKLALVQELEAALTADEVDLEDDGSIRLWWD